MNLYSLKETSEFEKLSSDDRKEYFTFIAKKCFTYWNIPKDAILELINYTENATFKIEFGNEIRIIMRVHRCWYTNRESILSEIAWLNDLKRESLQIPKPIKNIYGEYIIQVDTIYGNRFVDCQQYENGKHVDFSEHFNFEKLGEIIATIHNNSVLYKKPKFYSRINWDFDRTFSHINNFHNENYKENLYLSLKQKKYINKAEKKIKCKLDNYGKNVNNYGIIHSDCRFANILENDDGYVLLDFDDCGDGWFMYDLASVFGFNEDNNYLEVAKTRLLEGYQSIRPIQKCDIEMIDTFILMRQIGLIGTGMFFEKYAICGKGEKKTNVYQWHSFYDTVAKEALKYCSYE